ncbi:hypothetical protein QCA50_010588 [Cerrena zonata]|uniref:beta-galactosidase n=1 Tax=Cerrena zonata TaxID=2478898 RepID=A0AAW0G7U8_9APHY
MNEMRLQGLFLRVSKDLLSGSLLANGTNYTTSNLIHTSEIRNLDNNAAFYFLRHNDATSLALTPFQLNITTSAGQLLIPQNSTLVLDGRESKIIVTDYTFGASNSKILYSTTEVMTWTTIDNRDYLILYALPGQSGETVFNFGSTPDVNLDNAPGVTSSISGNSVTLNYKLQGISSVTITSGGKTIEVLIMDKSTALQWNAVDIPGRGNFGGFFSFGTNQSVLIGGPYLVRTANIKGGTLALTGDLNGATNVEVIAPGAVRKITWNGAPQKLEKTSRNSLTFTGGSNVPSVTLPTLDSWKVVDSLPEIQQSFDDSNWITADQTTTNYSAPLSGDRVLYSQQYGFYGGYLLFRGHFNATGSETAVSLTVQGGFAFGYSAFLNGVFLGSNQGNATVSQTSDTWPFPDGALKTGEDNVVVVLQAAAGKEPRGIRGYALVSNSSTSTTFSHWKLQGNQGGASNAPDTYRGYLNEGGLYAERIGAHLPGFPDQAWPSGSPVSDGVNGAGVNFYRTTFDLNLPRGFDVPIRLTFTPSDITSNYRVQIFINGWQFGKYTNNIGPQTTYVLPAGILHNHGTNTLAISLWSLDGKGATLAGVQLTADGTFESALALDGRLSDFGVEEGLYKPEGRATLV